MKLCKDCQHFRPGYWCTAPENGISLVDGSAKAMFASERRSILKDVLFKDTVKCGPEAVNFKPRKVAEKRPWWAFWTSAPTGA